MPIGPRRNAWKNRILPAGLLAAMLLIGGCAAPADQASAAKPANRPPAALSAIDPCASNLHDISGAMLIHLNLHGRFPPALDTLQPLPGEKELSFTCPASGRPYIFNPAGIHLVERAAYIIVYDAQPAHNGLRWAIIMDEPTLDKAPVMKVSQIPESLFLLHQSK